MDMKKNQGTPQPIIAAAALIAILSLASRVLGLLRDRLLAHTYGAGPTLDAYYAAFRIPDLLFNLLGLGALTAAFLPIYLRIRGRDVRHAQTFASSVCSDLTILLLGLSVIGAIFARPLFRMMTPGFEPDVLALTITIGRTMFLATLLLGISTVSGGILQAERRFFAFAAAPLLYNAGILVGILGFTPMFGPAGIAWGVVLGAACHLIIQAVAARRATGVWVVWWRPAWRDADVQRTGVLLVPRMLGLASNQLALAVVAGIASTLAAGSLAVFTFANNIQMVPVSLIGIAFAVAAFPQFVSAARDPTPGAFRTQFSTTVREIALLAIPSVVILLALKAQVVRVLLGSGRFDWDDTLRTLGALEAFGFGLFWAMLVPLLTRSFYAFEDTRTPFVIGIVADVLAIGAAFALGHTQGPRGLAFAISIGVTVQAVLLIAALRARVGPLDGRRIGMAMVKFGVAAFAMALVIQIMKPIAAAITGTGTLLGIGLQGMIAGGCGVVVYLIVGVLLRSPEITALTATLHRGVLRAVRLPFGGADEARG